MDKRVKFDFEITFSNGGGIQGQDFRLDIDGDDISDEELGRYIVADMRLLMVKDVKILNKQIIEEKHKRAVAKKPVWLLNEDFTWLVQQLENIEGEQAERIRTDLLRAYRD